MWVFDVVSKGEAVGSIRLERTRDEVRRSKSIEVLCGRKTIDCLGKSGRWPGIVAEQSEWHSGEIGSERFRCRGKKVGR